VSGLWCGLQLDLASGFLGFQLASPAGFVEFFSVYGGLQVGLGMAMLVSSFRSDYVEASLYFSAIFSTFLLLFRVLSFAIYGLINDFIVMLIIEVVIFVGLWWAWFKAKSPA
tara:strand:+ start:1158 stop:1493 length:336 start_codon:yes stop_codon:yes gene_type:complete